MQSAFVVKGSDIMAKDDYHVIVYQILAYLYQRLKKGERVDALMLEQDNPYRYRVSM